MNNKYLPWAIVVVLIAVVGWMTLGPDDDSSEMMDDDSEIETQVESRDESDDAMIDDEMGDTSVSEETEENNEPEVMSDPEKNDEAIVQADGTLNGTLQLSDDESKGNLMLVQNTHTLYINTGRDFSELIGKEVSVKIDGTLESFTLLSIEEK